MIEGIFMSNRGMVGDREGDFAHAILQIDPTGMSPLFGLLSGMPNESLTDSAFTWYEDVHQSGRLSIVSGGTNTDIVVGDASGVIPNQLYLVEQTGEIVFVLSNNGNTITVMRGFSGTSTVAVTNVMFLQLIGNAHPEGSTRPTAVTQQGRPRTNVTQIWRNAWAVSGTAKAIKFRTGSRVAHSKRTCALYHAEDIERSLLYGRKAVLTMDGKPMRVTDGVLAQIEQYGGHVESAANGGTAGNYSRLDFEEFIRKIFAKNVKGQPNERIAFCGDIVLKVINNMAALDGVMNMTAGETKMGIKITEVMTPFGMLKLMTHAMMNENATWAKELYALHPGAIKRRTLRPTFSEGYDADGKRIDGIDADEGLMTTEMGVQVGAAQTMGILRNVTTAVKSNP